MKEKWRKIWIMHAQFQPFMDPKIELFEERYKKEP